MDKFSLIITNLGNRGSSFPYPCPRPPATSTTGARGSPRAEIDVEREAETFDVVAAALRPNFVLPRELRLLVTLVILSARRRITKKVEDDEHGQESAYTGNKQKLLLQEEATG